MAVRNNLKPRAHICTLFLPQRAKALNFEWKRTDRTKRRPGSFENQEEKRKERMITKRQASCGSKGCGREPGVLLKWSICAGEDREERKAAVMWDFEAGNEEMIMAGLSVRERVWERSREDKGEGDGEGGGDWAREYSRERAEGVYRAKKKKRRGKRSRWVRSFKSDNDSKDKD